MEAEGIALLCRSCFIPLNQEGTKGLSVGALPSTSLRRIGMRGYIGWQKFSLVPLLPSGSLPAAVRGAFWWQSSKAEPYSAFLIAGFLLGIGAGAWVLLPLSLVLANVVILDALAFPR